jgi:hypothetical protein
MTPKRPISLAVLNLIMLAGILPIMVAGYYYRILHPHAGGIPVAITVFYAYLCAPVVAGIAAGCSIRICRKHKVPPSALTIALWIAVLASIIVPFFFF